MSSQQFRRKSFRPLGQVMFGLLFVWFGLCTSESASAQSGQTYYVATDGDDENLGTFESPFGTIQHAVYTAEVPGDTVYVRGGTYHEAIQFTRSGTAENPIRILAYPDEKPVIDGQYLLPEGSPVNPQGNNPPIPPEEFVYAPLARITGDYVEFRGFSLIRSRGRGITVGGQANNYSTGVIISDCIIQSTRNAGIIALLAEDLLIERCHVTDAGNYAPYSRTASELNWPVAVNAILSSNVTLREMRIHHNWTEGIAAGRDSQHVTIEDSLIYNNFALQLYVHRSQHVTVTRNLLYHTNETAYQRGGDPSQCIVINNESSFTNSLTVDHVQIKNNVVVGCRKLIASWGSGSNLPISNVTIEHNTLVDAFSNVNAENAAAISVADANLTNMTIQQNVVSQNGFQVAEVIGNPPVTFAENAWSSQPITATRGTGDWIGDPELVNPNAPIAPGEVSVNWYKPGPSSPLHSMTMGPTDYIINAHTTGTPCWPMAGCPPEEPTLTMPLGSIEEASPTFVWQEVSGATSYTLAVYSVDSDAIVFMDTYPLSICTSQQCSVQPSGLVFNAGDYRWLVRGHNEFGAGEWGIHH